MRLSMIRILLAEDDAAMRQYLERALEKAGYAVTAVDRGTAALPLIEQERFDLLLQFAALLSGSQTWSGTQVFNGSVDFAVTPTVNGAPIAAGSGEGGTALTAYTQVSGLSDYPTSFPSNWNTTTNKPAVIAAGTTAALARTAIGFDPAARAAVPYGYMAWDSVTDTWWAYDPASNTFINGGARPNCPPGTCVYDARNDAAATLPTGTQAPQKFGNLPGDTFRLNQSSPLWPV